ncbi:MAG: DNA alkylation repair protein [Caulobacteraceae bacterium]
MSSKRDLEAKRLALLDKLRASARPYRGGEANDSYTGSTRPFFNVSTPELRRLAREWLADHRKGKDPGAMAMVDRLFAGEYFEEKVLAALTLGASSRRAHRLPRDRRRFPSGDRGARDPRQARHRGQVRSPKRRSH